MGEHASAMTARVARVGGEVDDATGRRSEPSSSGLEGARSVREIVRGNLAGGRFTGRRPVHPGRLLETLFLRPLCLSQQQLARELRISRRRVNELVRGHRNITPDTAIRLGLYFDTEPAFWMELQAAWDMHLAWRRFRGGGAGD